jgi:hypothetical protein
MALRDPTGAGFMPTLVSLAFVQAGGNPAVAQKRAFEIAVSQLLLDGGPQSINRFAEWRSSFGKLDSPDSVRAFTRFVNQLRADLLETNSDLSESNIQKALLGTMKAKHAREPTRL